MNGWDYMKQVEEEFFKKLEAQTSWGKDQLKRVYLEVKNEVSLRVLQAKDDSK